LDEAIRRGQAYLAAHSTALAAKLDQEFGEERAANLDLRRFNACMDHILGRRAIYRNECHGVHYPFLPADEFFDKRLFPWLADVERHTDAIRAEALALLEEPGEALRPYVRMDKGLPENKWSELDQSLDWGACFLWEDGEPNQAVLDRCPATAAALELAPQSRIPGKAPSSFFSILKPGARIPPHTGVTNARAIIHLPLVVPPGCWFRVGGETRQWVEGEAFAFDDTIEHEAHNPSDQIRIVLIFDVWNPHLTEQEQDHLVRFFGLLAQ
jgi:aspartyl/asparaginyl beta-hydroxylase (cupin superfamily)